MEDFFTAHFWVAVGQIIMIDILLGGDNAVVIALAAVYAEQALGFAQAGPAGLWGRSAPLTQALRDGDRVELYRPLTVDPKVARRERFARQGARTTGLFARRRPGGKSGY